MYFSQSLCAVLAEHALAVGAEFSGATLTLASSLFPASPFLLGPSLYGSCITWQMHHLTDASLGPWCCIPIITSTILTEPSGCDSSSGLKSKRCSQGGWVDLGIKPDCSSTSLAVAAGQRSPYKANCFHRKHGRESWTTQTWWKRSTSGWNCQ